MVIRKRKWLSALIYIVNGNDLMTSAGQSDYSKVKNVSDIVNLIVKYNNIQQLKPKPIEVKMSTRGANSIRVIYLFKVTVIIPVSNCPNIKGS